MTDTFTVDGVDGAPLAAARWTPAGQPRGVVVLVHGMGEHFRRYVDTAEAFVKAGYVVYAYDHRGHGDSVLHGREAGDLGPEGWAKLVDDVGVVVALARVENPDLPLALLGHSMGSFATQQFLLRHSGEVDAVILSGTAAIDILEPALDLDAGVDLSAFNAPFEPARTDYDWLSRDERIVDAYVADPLCGFGIDAASGKAMFAGSRPVADPEAVGQMRSDLPILIAVGDRDPLNGELALVQALVAHYRAGGLTDVDTKVYPGARHEILNETVREQVRTDLIAWLDSRLG